jgi:hypothetical protein
VIWLVGQGLWLAPAFLLEFKGINSLQLVWAAGLIYFASNIYVAKTIIAHHTPIGLVAMPTKQSVFADSVSADSATSKDE